MSNTGKIVVYLKPSEEKVLTDGGFWSQLLTSVSILFTTKFVRYIPYICTPECYMNNNYTPAFILLYESLAVTYVQNAL